MKKNDYVPLLYIGHKHVFLEKIRRILFVICLKASYRINRILKGRGRGWQKRR